MTIKKPDDFEKWELENSRMRKSLPTDLIPEKSDNKEDEEFYGLLLSLAMIFNDLKGLIILNDTISAIYIRQDGGKVNEHVGELTGVQLQLLKFLYATLHEALVFIEESQDIIQSEKFQKLLNRTSGHTQQVWEMINKISREEPINDERFLEYLELSDLLRKIRNNVGFHYQTRKQLIEGYRTFFYSDAVNTPSESKQWAYRSPSSEFVQSRYYYSDAALQGYYVNIFGDDKPFKERSEQIFALLRFIVYSIHDLLTKHHSTLPNR